jgi:hypothetical protein
MENGFLDMTSLAKHGQLHTPQSLGRNVRDQQFLTVSAHDLVAGKGQPRLVLVRGIQQIFQDYPSSLSFGALPLSKRLGIATNRSVANVHLLGHLFGRHVEALHAEATQSGPLLNKGRFFLHRDIRSSGWNEP